MNQTFQNSAQVLSVGIFFTLMIVGLSATLPHTLASGLEANGVPPATAHAVAPAAAGLDPVRRVPRLQPDPAPRRPARARRAAGAQPGGADRARRSSRTLISAPFRDGLHAAFAFAMVACLVAAAASAMRGGRIARRASSSRRSSMQLEWYGQSAFRLTRRRHDGLHRPVRRPVARCAAAGCAGTTRRSTGVSADLLLVTHEHLDHNGVGAIGGDPAVAALDRRARTSRRSARSSASPPSTTRSPGRSAGRTRSSPSRSAACASRTSATSARPRCAHEQLARSGRSTCCSCPSAAARRSAPSRRCAIVEQVRRARRRPDALPDGAHRLPRAGRRVRRALRRASSAPTRRWSTSTRCRAATGRCSCCRRRRSGRLRLRPDLGRPREPRRLAGRLEDRQPQVAVGVDRVAAADRRPGSGCGRSGRASGRRPSRCARPSRRGRRRGRAGRSRRCRTGWPARCGSRSSGRVA